MTNDELMHHGILGMKWGVRRYQNPDGSLTPAGKKRYQKEIDRANSDYTKYANAATRNVNKTRTARYIDAYNRTADAFNNGLTEKYNKEYEERKGNNAGWMDDPEYVAEYNKQFDALLNKNYNEALYNDIMSDKNYIKSRRIVEKYGIENLNDFVKSSESEIEKMRKSFERSHSNKMRSDTRKAGKR